ncbi:MAG: hypothetical protein AAFW46_07170 [Pseudomonadota bacterium]
MGKSDAATKIATCCYCGTRDALCLRTLAQDRGRRGLACRACGAPLHVMKALKTAPPAKPDRPKARAAPRPQPARPAPKPRKKKRSFHWGRWAADQIDELFDEIEDLFD